MKSPLQNMWCEFFALDSNRRAFSLFELLAVIAVLSVLFVAAAPALRGVVDGVNITGAAGMVEAEFLMARQLAMSRNVPVEVRIYKGEGGVEAEWKTVAVVIPGWVSGQSSDEWVARAKDLPGSVVIETSGDYSTVLKGATPLSADRVAPWSARESGGAPANLINKDYVGFLFNPDGSTNLPNGKAWCLTLKDSRGKPTETAPAVNYSSIIVDSLTGRTLLFQP